MEKVRKRAPGGGRKPKPEDEKYITPQFFVGRVPMDTQQEIRRGCLDGYSFKDWAVEVLLRESAINQNARQIEKLFSSDDRSTVAREWATLGMSAADVEGWLKIGCTSPGIAAWFAGKKMTPGAVRRKVAGDKSLMESLCGGAISVHSLGW